MTQRVVITGIGPVSPAGIGVEPFYRDLLCQGLYARPVPTEFDRAQRLSSRFYIPLPGYNLEQHDIPSGYKGLWQPEQEMSILGAKLALEDAGIRLTAQDKRFTGEGLEGCPVVIGTGMGGLETSFKSYLAHTLGEQSPKVVSGGQARFNRMVIPMTMPNSSAAWVSILFGLHGQAFTINASCASGTYAIGEAFRRIADGRDDIAITGGVENLHSDNGAVMRGFDILGALTKTADGRPMPFSEIRSGFLFAEGGACLLVLESLERARRRGARIYAEIAAFAASSDCRNIVQMDPTGLYIEQLFRKLAEGNTVDYVNSHGTGTGENDRIEAAAIRTVFGDRADQPLIGATKGLLGHTLGASGAFEAAATALAINQGRVHGCRIEQPMDDLNLVTETTEQSICHAISTSYGFGGHNGGLLLSKVKD